MPRTVKSSMTPLIVGTLAAALLRHWRMTDNDRLAEWLALIQKAIERDAESSTATSFETHHLSELDGYGAWADSYDGFNPLIAREQPVIEAIVDTIPPGHALDAACGTGRISKVLADRGFSVVGVDQSEAMLAHARAKTPNATFEIGKVESLPVDDGTFDLAVSCLAITHCDPTAVIGELARAVKPGGRVIVSEAHPFNAFLGARPSFPLAEGTMAMVRGDDHSMSAYIDAINAAGLTIDACREPAFRDEDLETIFGQYEADYGPGFLAANKAGLLGFPMAVIWELRKPG